MSSAKLVLMISTIMLVWLMIANIVVLDVMGIGVLHAFGSTPCTTLHVNEHGEQVC